MVIKENEFTLEREVSCRVINSVLKYLETRGYATAGITEGLPYSREYLTDPFNWVTSSVRETVALRAADLVKDDAVMYKVGLMSPSLKSISGVEQMVLLLGGPGIAYRSIQKYAGLFDRLVRYKVSVDGNKATVNMSWPGGYPVSKTSCYYTQGMLAAIPTLWGLPPAEIREKTCLCQPGDGGPAQGVEYDAGCCEYEVTWQPLPPWYSKQGRKLSSPAKPGGRSLNELEENFHLLDKKNAELRLRNSQLAKVREIALAANKVVTSSAVYESIVELARDIPGVGFVLILQIDESGKDIVAPYYSRIRNQKLVRALKVAGFDLASAFGEKSNSRKFRYPESVSSLTSKYLEHRRPMFIQTLAELLEGIWPKAVCDTVQRIVGVNGTAIIPVYADNAYYCSILFILNAEVPLDILEMVGAHCSTALKNAALLETLNLRNRELAAINEIALQTSSSLELDRILENSIRVATEIFTGKAGTVYLLDKKRQALRLAAQYGLPKLMVRELDNLPLDGSMMGGLFNSDQETVTGDLSDQKLKYPGITSAVPRVVSSYYASARLHSKNENSGMMTVVRENGASFNKGELRLLSVIANQVSIAVENAGLHQNAVRRAIESEKAKHELEDALSSLTVNERKYRLITEHTIDYITIVDFKGVFKYISPSHKRLGYEGADLLGKSAFDFIQAGDRKQLLPLLAKYFAMQLKDLVGLRDTHFSESINFAFVDKSGNWHYMEAIASLTDATDGNGLEILLISRDLTEHREAERVLKESEEKYRTVFESANDIILLLDEKGKIVDVNARLKEIGGWDRDVLIGKNISAMTHIVSRKHLPIIMANFLKRMAGMSVRPYQVEMVRSNGEPAIIEINATAVKRNGKVVGDLAILRDVTEYRKSQEALTESEAYLKDMFDSSVVGIIVIDPETHQISDLNKLAAAMIGDSKERIIGATCHNYICPAECGKCPITDLGQKIDNSERILICADGHEKDILKTVVSVVRNGRKQLMETIVDISQRKRSEAELRANRDLIDRILVSTPNAVMVVNKDNRIILANPAFYQMFGLPQHKAVGRRVEEVTGNHELTSVISETLAGRPGDQQVEFKYRQETFDRVLIASVIKMDKDEILVLLDDVTDARERQAKFILTERLVSVGEMASGVAHELNNPLTSVISLSQLLLKEDAPKEMKEDLEAIYSEARRAAAIVKNLLTFARKHAPERRPAQINAIVDDVLKLRAYDHRVSNIRVITQLEPQLPQVMIDSFQVQQVFLNLILNAEYAMRKAHNKGTLTITTEKAGGIVRISFKDDGTGISPENMKHLFNPFFTTKEVGTGTGLGLSICYGIVTNHGGRIYADSTSDPGATFVVELPVTDKLTETS